MIFAYETHSTIFAYFQPIFDPFAINPQKEYSVPIEERGRNFEELKVETDDGFKINVWHLPSDTQGVPIIISESDAGNMGDWVHLGRFSNYTESMYGFTIIVVSVRVLTLASSTISFLS